MTSKFTTILASTILAISILSIYGCDKTCEHSLVKIPKVEPTCTENGLTEGIRCEKCGDIIEQPRIIPALDHHVVVDPAVEATIYADGLTEGSHCDICHQIIVPQTVIKAHKHNEIVDIGVVPTCESPGLSYGTHCSICGFETKEQQVLPPHYAGRTVEPAKDPTFDEPGYSEYDYCKDCGTIFSEKVIYPALKDEPIYDGDASNQDIKIWCDQRLSLFMSTIVGDFAEENKNKYKISLVIDDLGTDSAAFNALEDTTSCADLFITTSSYVNRLINKDLLAPITGSVLSGVESKCTNDSITYGSKNSTLYALPVFEDSCCFMFYDRRVVKEEHIDSFEDIIADCESADKLINFGLFGNGWYSKTLFNALGISTSFTFDANNKVVSIQDNMDSENGLKALKYVQYLKQHNIFGNSDDPSKLGRSLGVCVSGLWNYPYAVDAIGDNLGCAILPSFTIDGESYRLKANRSFSYLCIKKTNDSKKYSVLMRLASYIRNRITRDSSDFLNYYPVDNDLINSSFVNNKECLKVYKEQIQNSIMDIECPPAFFASLSSLCNSVLPDSNKQELQFAINEYKENLSTFLVE